MNKNEAEMVDVTIVGYGPVGHLDHEAMHIIQTIGATEDLEAIACHGFNSSTLIAGVDWPGSG